MTVLSRVDVLHIRASYYSIVTKVRYVKFALFTLFLKEITELACFSALHIRASYYSNVLLHQPCDRNLNVVSELNIK